MSSPDQRRPDRSPKFGMLVFETPLELIEMSLGGCLVQVTRFVEPGTIGRLRVEVGGTVYWGYVRVARCEPMTSPAEGYHVGVEFLRVGRRPHWSESESLGSEFLAMVQGQAEAPANDRATERPRSKKGSSTDEGTTRLNRVPGPFRG